VADFNLNGLPDFPNGTSVKAYPLSNWNGASYTGAAPVGSEDATATVTAGVAAFTGLDADTSYVAYAQVSSEHRYKKFSTLSEYARNTGGSGGALSDGSVTAAKLAATLAAIEAWTDLGNLGATETINGAANKVIRRKGTLDQACAITLSTSADQQIELVLAQDGTPGRAATFTGVNVWLTNAGTAPDLTGRAALAVDRFFFENVGGVVYGYWLTETISAGGSLTVQDENSNVATGVTQIDFQGLNVSAASGSGEVVVSVADQVAANTQTGSYTAVLADAGKVVEMNSASATVLTVPPNSSVAFPVGTVIEVSRLGAGAVTIAQGSGVVLRNRLETAGTTNRTIASQYGAVSLRKRATDEWVLVGDFS
jgi:hypothetical protein